MQRSGDVRVRAQIANGLCQLATTTLVFWLLLSSASLIAQNNEVQAPRILALPELTVPLDVEVPETGRIEAIVIVQPDGSASVDACQAGAELCARVADALVQTRFEPARRGGIAIAARVRIALQVVRPRPVDEIDADAGVAALADPVAPAAHAAEGGSVPTSQALPNLGIAPAEPDAYGAHAKVQRIKQPGMRRLELAEMRDMPGAFGDPFRAVEVLPGIVPVLSGLPYFYVRGSPPAGTVYYYDGIQVPSLYHLALGPAVIHPQMVGPIRLYSGAAPARYGRLIGGVLVGEGPAAPDGKTHGELDLRLLDVSGYVQTDVFGGSLTAAGRYGYPGLVVSLISPEVDLAYWDYQLRYSRPTSPHDRIDLVALGAYDRLKTGPNLGDQFALQFHRIEPRFIHQTLRDQLGVALMFGWEESMLGSELVLSATRLTPRAWYEHRFEGGSRLRLSADALGLWGGLISQSADGDTIATLGVGDLGNGFRSVLGLQSELDLQLSAAVELQAGARVDAWLQPEQAAYALDPRLRAILHASKTLDFHVAGGTTRQPAVGIIPLPGLSDFASARELQSALQLETGVGVDLPIDVRAELQLFAHRYKNLVFSDTLLSGGGLTDNCAFERDCPGQKLPGHIDGWAYGAELYLRRPFTHALSGVLSYTLAWATLERVLGQVYTPTWDVRHLVNLVLQWDIGGGFTLGLRGFFRSGKASGQWYVIDSMFSRIERRLPGFLRADLQFSYSWNNAWARMRFGFEWFNFTISREPIDLRRCEAPGEGCVVGYATAIFAPNLSLRADFH